MKEAQKPDHLSLNSLISRLREGRYVIPDFQRDFEWMPWDIQELMRSIFLDYFIGSLLRWRGKKENFEALSCERIYGHPENGSPEYIVLDGQQRLTALNYAFLAPDISLPNRNNRFFYYIQVDRFMRQEYDAAFGYDWLKRRWEKLLGDQAEQYRVHLFPLSVVGKTGWELANWMQGYERYWEDEARNYAQAGDLDSAEDARLHARNARGFGEHVREITEKYQVSYIELDRDLGIEKVCDIFTQINSRGVRLDVFDLINALLKPKGLQLKHMWRGVADRLSFIESERLNVYVLQVMSILRQGYCSPKYLYYLLPGQEKTVRDPDGKTHKEVLVKDTGAFAESWSRAVDALSDAIAALRHPQEYGAIHSAYVPYESILPCFAALRSHSARLSADKRLVANRKIRQWYWASVFLNRYSGSVESTAARDFLDVCAWMDDDDAQPLPIREFAERYRNLDLRKETKKGTSIYNGIFNLLVIQGAKDWVTGAAPQHDTLDDHHIVPASWGKSNGLGDSVHSILNRSPLSADTNRNVIRERLPNEYLPELIAASGESTVRAVLESHLVSPTGLAILLRDPFGPADFDEFIAERQRSILEAIKELLIKERLDLLPDLRRLDERVESIELRLRNHIAEALNDEPSRLPSHITQKIRERLDRAVKRNPALDAAHYATLVGMLEYADLRELQDAMSSGALWPLFQDQFGTKEALAGRFNQLAELRNALRHSRAVDSVTRLDGEAALHWFEAVLPNAAEESTQSDCQGIG